VQRRARPSPAQPRLAMPCHALPRDNHDGFKMTPTQLTLKALRADGWLAQVTEHWNHHARRRQDLWGCIDVLALKGDVTLGVQCTSGSNVAARVKKMADIPVLGDMRKASWRLEVWGWRKAANGRWTCRVVDVS
jgi:hypothetical protein